MQLLLQQRDPSTLRCYQDVLDEKHDRAFKGTVIVLLDARPPARRRPRAKVIGGTLNNKEVSDCLVEKLKDFEYPRDRPDRARCSTSTGSNRRIELRSGGLPGSTGLRSAEPRAARVIASAPPPQCSAR